MPYKFYCKLVAIFSLIVYQFGTFFERVANQRSKLRQYLKPNLYKYDRENNFTLSLALQFQHLVVVCYIAVIIGKFSFFSNLFFINSNKYETNFRELDIQKKFKGFLRCLKIRHTSSYRLSCQKVIGTIAKLDQKGFFAKSPIKFGAQHEIRHVLTIKLLLLIITINSTALKSLPSLLSLNNFKKFCPHFP